MNNSKKLKIGLIFVLLSVVLTAAVSAQDPWDDYYGADEAAGWALFGLGLLCIIPIIWLIIAILIAIWVYRDAEKRGSSGVLWLIIVIIAGIIGLIIWLVVRPPIGGAPVQQVQQPQQPAPGRTCPNCGRAIPTDARTCPYCAKKFEES